MMKPPSERPPAPRTVETSERPRRLDFAEIKLLGGRVEQQDVVIVESMDFKGRPVVVVAIADGHGEAGEDAAREAAIRAFTVVEKRQTGDERSLQEAFHQAHEIVNEYHIRGGCTLTLAVVDGDLLTVGWAGNTQVQVYSKDGDLHPLTLPHEYGVHPEETARLSRMNAEIVDPLASRSTGYGSAPTLLTRGHIKVGMDRLEVSRSIGDNAMEPFVTHDPELKQVSLTDVERFLIVASDGLWHVLEDESKRQRFTQVLKGCATAEDAKGKLHDLLTTWMLDDNTTLAIVGLERK